MIRIELLPKTAQTHAQMLRRAIVHLEENRRLAAWSTAGAIGEIQQSLRAVAELLEAGAEVERLERERDPIMLTCVDCGRPLWMSEAKETEHAGAWVCRDTGLCRLMGPVR